MSREFLPALMAVSDLRRDLREAEFGRLLGLHAQFVLGEKADKRKITDEKRGSFRLSDHVEIRVRNRWFYG